MSDENTKPREWTLTQAMDFQFDVIGPDVCSLGGVAFVIERSAYDALARENESLVAQLSYERDAKQAYLDQMLALEAERDAKKSDDK